jgi:hypothetical protein
LREKGGDSDWYGYCLDDPVNRVDVWGLEAEDAEKGGKPYYCGLSGGVCDENGTLQGDYKPIDIHEGALPFLIDPTVPLPKKITDAVGMTDKDDPKELRVPVMFDPLVEPFMRYHERNSSDKTK